MSVRNLVLALALALAGLPARSDPQPDPDPPVDLGLDLRYRYEAVDQDDVPLSADASTIQIRARLATREHRGISGLIELDRVEAIGAQRYDDTRNGDSAYPVVADPEGTDLNQAWVQFAPGAGLRTRLGRQRINLGDQRFVGSSDWRQNEQTLDALRIEATAPRGVAFDYAYAERVNRVFGPDSGTPPATLEGDIHLFNASLSPFGGGSLSAYAYHLDFEDAPQLSSRSLGARIDGKRDFRDGATLGWTLDYARQQDAGGNPLPVHAAYARAEVRVMAAGLEFQAGRESLSGARDPIGGTTNRAFQTPLATLHKWQGWADKFATTPPPGVEDRYVGFGANRSGWRFKATWHDFAAEAAELHYGTELDVSVTGRLGRRLELLLKFADFRADDAFADTRKFWAQLAASF